VTHTRERDCGGVGGASSPRTWARADAPVRGERHCEGVPLHGRRQIRGPSGGAGAAPPRRGGSRGGGGGRHEPWQGGSAALAHEARHGGAHRGGAAGAGAASSPALGEPRRPLPKLAFLPRSCTGLRAAASAPASSPGCCCCCSEGGVAVLPLTGERVAGTPGRRTRRALAAALGPLRPKTL